MSPESSDHLSRNNSLFPELGSIWRGTISMYLHATSGMSSGIVVIIIINYDNTQDYA